MKLFFIISTVIFSLLQAADSVPPEIVLYNYAKVTKEIKDILKTMSSRFDHVDERIDTMLLDMKHNITNLREHYGASKFKDYQKKYSNESIELKRFVMSKNNCSTYIPTVLKTNEWQQSVLSTSIAKYLKYWKDGYDNLDTIIIEVRVRLANLEKEAHTCGKQFNGSESPKSWQCARKVFDRVKGIKVETSYDIDDELDSLTERKEEVLVDLYESLQKENLFRFYDDEKVIDDWLTTNCSK